MSAEEPFLLRVECYAGYRGEQYPRRLFIGRRRVEVQEVIDSWLAPDHRYFRVATRDGGLYLLRHDVVHDRWELKLFEDLLAGSERLK